MLLYRSLLSVCLLGVVLLFTSRALADNFTIGILVYHYGEHEQEVVDAFRDGIELSGIDHQFDMQVANGDAAKCRDILVQWQEQDIDLIYTVGVDATRIAEEEGLSIPVVFAIESDPVNSFIVESLYHPGQNLTGVSNWVTAYRKLDIFRSAFPELQRLGVIYDPNNAVSSMEVEEAVNAAESLGITLVEQSINNDLHIEQALNSLRQQQVQALWLPFEKTLYHHMQQIGAFSKKHHLPVFSSTLSGVDINTDQEPFAMVGIGIDHERLGKRSVHFAINLLTGQRDASTMPVEILDPYIIANVNSANAIGVKLPPLFLANSDKIIRGYAGQKIIIGGTGDSQQLLRELARALENKLKGGAIEVPDSIGSTGGIKALLAGRIDLARTARLLRESEQQYNLTSLVFARSPVVFVTHPSVTGIDNLTTQQVLDIYRGRIKNWEQLGGNNARIYAIKREPGDSSRIALGQHISGLDAIDPLYAKTIYSTPETVAALRKHRYTVGYTSLSEVNNSELKVLKFNGVYPSSDNVNSGAYPLTSTFALVFQQRPTDLAEAFVDFVFSDQGQQIIREYGAIPVAR